MCLTTFLTPSGYDQSAWRLPGSRSAEVGQLPLLKDIVIAFERAKVDAVFLADTITAEPMLAGGIAIPYEPITALSALAAVTSHVGLIGTVSTTFNHPYTVARQLAALDVLSAGRAGWNIVTSYAAFECYGYQVMPPKQERYRRAVEFVDVVGQLWAGWSDRAVINDRSTGFWLDPAQIRQVDHHGEHFDVSGFINQRRSPQGRPVMVQAGQSPEGLQLGSSVADIVYTAQPLFDAAVAFYATYKELVAGKGRDPGLVKILPGLVPYLGETEREATELRQQLAELVDLDVVLGKVEAEFGIALSDLALDRPVPSERFAQVARTATAPKYSAFQGLAAAGATLRELLIAHHTGSGHLTVVGTPGQVADEMERWFRGGACDGFSLNPPTVPGCVQRICEMLIPELQARGVFRREYTATTLRGHLGLPAAADWTAMRADSGLQGEGVGQPGQEG